MPKTQTDRDDPYESSSDETVVAPKGSDAEKTALRVLDAVKQGTVWRYFDRVESADIEDGRALVNGPIYHLEGRGLVRLTDRQPNTPRRRCWALTVAGEQFLAEATR